MARILVLSAHPDDEVLGAGGTIARHVAEGDAVHWVVATRGWEPRFSAATIAAKAAEVDAVAEFMGYTSHRVLGLPTTRLDELPLNECIAPIAAAMQEIDPEVVYTVHAGDVHSDHAVVARALWTAAKPFRTAAGGPRRICAWETLSSTEAAPPPVTFHANSWVAVDDHLERKLAAMALYASECQDDPLPRGPAAIRALARWRGAQVGTTYAEAFMVLREYR